MVFFSDFVATLWLARSTLTDGNCDGAAFVECGVWRGGMAAALMDIGGSSRNYYFFDSFRGLPPPTEEDGEQAKLWSLDKNGPRYFNNCSASLEEFNRTIATVGVNDERIHVFPGWFSDTTSQIRGVRICVLRLDGDWYESTYCCLEAMWENMVKGGVIVIDDYYHWEGCRKAVHDFLSSICAPEAIETTCIGKTAFIRKL